MVMRKAGFLGHIQEWADWLCNTCTAVLLYDNSGLLVSTQSLSRPSLSYTRKGDRERERGGTMNMSHIHSFITVLDLSLNK